MKNIQKIIEDAFEQRMIILHNKVSPEIYDAIKTTINKLNNGTLRVANKINKNWITHEWIKKAILLSFYVFKNKLIKWGDGQFFDKIPNKFNNWNNIKFQEEKIRVVPPTHVRYGAYVAKNTILMPSYVNIGAYIDQGAMIDTWATVGSCAQIGKNVHLSGGVGIGGVLEPLQNNPTIIENDCFIGARSEIVEGVIVEEGSVISMGVFIGKSTKIYDRETGAIFYGKIPARSVVVPGNLPSKNGLYSLYCAVIVKKVDINTINKTKINEILRNIN
ncbi:2,3,4,5-tetrahydropyridine-2,6-dicarboxylate N-succinyltransferase [Blochmannia endosymbiont of Camponotus (Colobopsis) obliquus]|uniref:2,3,4,5-tetrahydropyridine-2,6-dicarboxylate N-succinyltransferase n=1 Tax=Blochmannia endosymbiont of Camponotus (Colobopsis) obliquus TaxID=1505597 RepID=UPI00061A730C|nr:2,3,4,5-tetrahydropyridine-2,6-dicarboxylate N-succinyltransferase [Blochmannia endosymbiont of Camponotus (Colobopsis) obliquus]AKC60435.1 2,3,4,5-tetrahydropyridine-2,6-dicarboxylate N-succinyltransferase [Blochmannia endosymbiont of Camponotus (Colobopsis) obliquus]